MRTFPLMAAATMAVLALSGCFGDETDDEPPVPYVGDDVVSMDGRPVAGHPLWVIDGNATPLPTTSYPGELPSFTMRYATQRISGEPTLGVSQHGNVFYAAIDFDQSLWVSGQPYTHFLRSFDQGVTWEDVTPKLMDTVPNQPATGDPYIHVDPDTNRVFALDMFYSITCNTVSWSDNEGKTWSYPRHGACPLPVSDHPTLFTGPKVHPVGQVMTAIDGVVNTYDNQVYLCSNQIIQAKCAYSLNGGVDWEPAVLVFPGVQPETLDLADVTDCFEDGGEECLESLCSGFTSHGTTDRNDGTVYVPRSLCGVPYISISRDGGMTYQYAPVTTAEEHRTAPGDHDTMVAVDKEGTVYYFWMGNGGRSANLVVSHDQGRTWGEVMNVTAPGLTGVKLPGIVAGEEGRISFLYMGTDNPRGHAVGTDRDGNATNQQIWENATWNAYIGYSLNADQEEPVFAITTANDVAEPLKRGDCSGRCPGNGREGGPYDFLDIEMDPITGQVYAALVDVCTGFCDEPGVTAQAPQRSFGAVGVQISGTRLTDGTEYNRPSPE